MAGLYDSYRLSNSNAVPMFEGSAGDTSIKVGQYMQGLYDTAQQGAGEISGNVENLNSLPWHSDAVNEVRNQVNSKLDNWAQRKDYENLVPDVQSLGRWYGSRAQELQAPVLQRQAYAKQLDEHEKGKEGELSSDQKQAYLAMSDEADKQKYLQGRASKKDAFGRYSLSYAGETPDKNINVNDWVDKRLKDYVIHKYGSESYQTPDGVWMVKNGEKHERLTPEAIDAGLIPAMRNDHDYQSYRNMHGKISSFYGGQAYKNFDKMPDSADKREILRVAKEQGLSPDTVARQYFHDQATRSIDSDALAYAHAKYMTKNDWTTKDMNADPYGLKKATDFTPFMMQGANYTTTNDEQDVNKLTENIGKLGTTVGEADKFLNNYKAKLANPHLDQTTRTLLESKVEDYTNQKASAQQQLERANQVLNNSKQAVADKMTNGGTWEEMIKTEAKPIADKITTMFGNVPGIKSLSGIIMKPNDIAEAIADGRVKVNSIYPSGAGGGGAPIPTSLAIKTKEGKTVTIKPDNPFFGQLSQLTGDVQQGQTGRIREANDLLKSMHKGIAKNFSIPTTDIGMSENEKLAITEDLKSSDGTNFATQGTNKPWDKDRRPTNFKITTINSMRGPNGETMYNAYGLDKDNKPDGTTFNVIAAGSNGASLESNFLGKQLTPEAKQFSAILRNGSGYDALKNLAPGTERQVGVWNVNGKPTDVRIKLQDSNTGDNSVKTYRIIDENGHALDLKDGKKGVYYNLGDAGEALDAIKSAAAKR